MSKIHGVVFSSALLSQLRRKARSGPNLLETSELIRSSLADEAIRSEIMRLQFIEEFMGLGLIVREEVEKSMPNECLPVCMAFLPTPRQLRLSLIYEGQRLEPFMQAYVPRNVVGAISIAIEHVHPEGNNGTKNGGTAVLNIVDSLGRPVASFSTTTKSLYSKGVQDMFRKIKEVSAPLRIQVPRP